MAKKIQIDIEVNGKMQKATVSAKKLNAALQDTSDSAQQTDRNIKGTAQASSNASKNFSKMSQGMGGLVGAYASLAASLFAVSAAFNFLKRAGELKSLQAGQTAYASATGTALRSLTNDIINATNAQISFRDAAQAAAIGTAAGLSADQLKRLGKAAADTSQILGRDVTDSFNRLIRGVTKAEPELLDELGIILRLERATTDYGLAIGKTADELTPFERSQAVANDVLTQAEEKYSKILDVVGRSPNQYAQLGKAFDDLVMKIQKITDVVAGPLAKVLQNTPSLAIASFLLLLRGPLAAMGVSFQDIAKNARESANTQIKALQDVSDRAKIATLNVSKLKQGFQDTAGKAYALNPNSKVLERASKGTMSKTDRANLRKALASAEAQYQKHGRIVKGIFKGMSIQMVTDVTGAFAQMEIAEQSKVANSKVAATKIELYYAKAATGVKVFGAALANFGVRLLNIAGWIGILATGYQVIKGFFNDDKPEQKQNTLLDVQREKIQKLNEELKHFVDIQRIMAEGTTGVKGFGAVAGVLDNLDTNTMTQAISEFRNLNSLQQQNLEIQKEIDRITAKNAAMRKQDALYSQAARTGRTEMLPAGRASEQSLEEVPKLIEIPESAKASSELLLKVRDSIKAIKEETGQTLGPFETLENMLSNPESFSEKQILSAVVAAQELGKTIRELPRLTTDASAALKGFTNSIAPKSQAQQTIDAIQKQLTAMKKIKDAGGVIDEKEFNKLAQAQKDIADFRDRAHKTALRQLTTQLKITNEVVGESQAARAVRDAQNEITQNADKQSDIQEKIKDIEETKKAITGELTPEDLNRLEILRAQLAVEEKISGILQQKLALQQELKPLRDSEVAINVERRRLQNLQQLVNLEQKKMGYVKEQADALETVLNARFDRALMSARSAGGHLDPRKEQAARIKLEEHLVKIKTAQINREFKMKMTTLTMEERNLKVRNKLAKIQYQIQMKELEQDTDATTLAMFDAIDKSISETARLGRETAEITRNTALETVDLTLDKLKQAAADMSFKGQMAQTFEESFRDGLNSALSGLISGDMSFKEAMMSFINTIADAAIKRLQDMLVDAIMEAIFGPEEDIAEKMERILKEEKMSSKVGEAIEEGGTSMAKKLDDVLSQEIQTKVKVECCEGGSGGDGEGVDGKTLLTIAGVAGAGYLLMRGMNGPGGGKMEVKMPGVSIPMPGGQRADFGTTTHEGREIEEVKVTAKKASMTFGERVLELFSGAASGVGDFFKFIFSGFRMPQIGGDGYNYAGISSESIDSQIDDIAGGAKKGSGGIFGWIKNFFGKIGDGASNLFEWFTGLFGDKKETGGLNLMQFAKDVLGSSEGEGTGIIGMFMKLFSTISGFFSGGQGGGGGGGGGWADIFNTVASFFTGGGGARYGGIMEPPRGYRAGGIANGSAAGYPAVLHGREAVVPLPHGNKIPVELKGAGGQQNNIGVTVNIASDGSSSMSQDNAQAEQEGKSMAAAISAAVTQELIKQRRAGGMLSPYGAA